jgi:hypothetical protein
MVCLVNLYESLTILAVFILIFYTLVCLPDNSLVLKITLALICSFATFAILAAFASDAAPTAPFTVTATYLVFFVFYLYVGYSLSQGFIILAFLLVAFPIALAAQDNLATWLEYETGWNIGRTGVLIVLLLLLLLGLCLAVWMKNNQFVWDVCKSFFYSVLAILAIRFISILFDQGNPHEFCCSKTEIKTCPVAFSAVYFIILAFFTLFRFVATQYWREQAKQFKEQCGCEEERNCYLCCWCCCGCCKRKKQKKLKEEKKKSQQIEEEQQYLITNKTN